MGLEGGGKTDIAQQDADAGSFQAEATGLLHAGQAKLAHGHDATAKPTSPKQVLPKSSNNHTAELKPGMPGLNTDNFHQQTRDLLFQHDTHGVPVAFQPQVDITAVGLPQIHFDNGAQPDNGDNVRPQQLPPEGSERPQPQPEFTNHIVKHGDNLWKIARENLEQGASNRVVANYVHQIEADNPMHDPNLIMPGQIIKVRGYVQSTTTHDTTYGAEQHNAEHHGAPEHYRSSSHHEHYHSVDQHAENTKSIPVRETKPTPIVPPPSPGGRPTPAKDTVLPQPSVKDNSGDKSPLTTIPNKDQEVQLLKPIKDTSVTLNIEQDRKQLAELAHNRMGNSNEYHRFVNNMYSFEQRAHGEMTERLRLQGKNSQEAANIVTQEIHDTYKNVGDLLRLPGTDKLTPVELQHLASEEMKQAAHWQNISQGQHETCQANVVEEHTYALAPAQASKLVTEVALTGKYAASDGTVVKVDPAPHDEARYYHVHPGQRSHASQIFQETAINLAWAKKDPSGETRFVWTAYNPKQQTPAGEELLRDGKRVSHLYNQAIPSGAPALEPEDLTMMSNLITGRHDKSIVIPNPTSPQSLQAKVQELEQHGELPAVLYVYAGHGQGPFSQAQPGWHTVLLGGYISAHNGEPGKIIVDNSWGNAWDRKYGAVDVNTLYQTTYKPPENKGH